MTWFPIGPDFIQQPRVRPYQRISRRNYWGSMGRVRQVAVEAGAGREPETIYAAVNDSLDGDVAIFRKRLGEDAWTCLTDGLRRADNNVDPRCVATHPRFPQQVYFGTQLDQGFYRSADRGDAWEPRIAMGGRLRKIVVDPRAVATVDDTIVYAATDNGLYRSPDNGDTWTLVLPGAIESFVLLADGAGGLFCYAGVYRSGLWFADSEPTSPAAWTNLTAADIGLPAFVPEAGATPDSFDSILVDACARNPACAYAWISRPAFTGPGAPPGPVVGLYKTTAPRAVWSLVSATPTAGGEPVRSYNPLHRCFAVAPSSPGDGANDILLYGAIASYRSIDSGATWAENYLGNHVDYMSFAFHPAAPAPGVIPDTYPCNDGGVFRSGSIADPAYDVLAPPVEALFNIFETVTPDSPWPENLTFGLENSLVHGLSSMMFLPPYIAIWDEGFAVRRGAKGWAMFPGASDGVRVEAAPSGDGTTVWTALVDTSIGADMNLIPVFHDLGPDVPPWGLPARMEGTSDYVWTQSNFALDSRWRCVAGAQVLNAVTTLTSDSGTGSGLTLNVVSTAGLTANDYVNIGGRPGSITDITPTSFLFYGLLLVSLPPGTPVNVWRDCVVAIGADGVSRRISQDFHPVSNLDYRPTLVAAGGALATRRLAMIERERPLGVDAYRLYRADESTTFAGPAMWDLLAADQPTGIVPSGMIVSRAGDIFVMLVAPISVDFGGTTISTPLFRIADTTDRWLPQRCDGFTPATFPDGTPHPFGPLAQDPLVDDVLYASQGGRVYRLTAGPVADSRVWADFSDSLPGALVTNIFAGSVSPSGVAPFPLLRISTMGRGIWESALPGAPSSGSSLYTRRNLYDQGWMPQIVDGIPDPYRRGLFVWHWEGADIRVEVPQTGAGGTFYSSDPEATGVVYSTASTPAGTLEHTMFELLVDASQAIPSAARVRVHVQVQNRSYTALDGVHVWMLWTQCGARLPLLNDRDGGGTFAFWDQFAADGSITNLLPADSRWKEVAPPVTLDGLDVNHPRIASFHWDAPIVAAGDAGHFCVVAFVHSADRPIGESTRTSIDVIVMDNKQVCQKNLHVLAP